MVKTLQMLDCDLEIESLQKHACSEQQAYFEKYSLPIVCQWKAQMKKEIGNELNVQKRKDGNKIPPKHYSCKENSEYDKIRRTKESTGEIEAMTSAYSP